MDLTVALVIGNNLEAPWQNIYNVCICHYSVILYQVHLENNTSGS